MTSPFPFQEGREGKGRGEKEGEVKEVKPTPTKSPPQMPWAPPLSCKGNYSVKHPRQARKKEERRKKKKEERKEKLFRQPSLPPTAHRDFIVRSGHHPLTLTN